MCGRLLLRVWRLALPTTLLFLSVSGEDYQNVYGNALQSCSQDGMALTGYTRTGYCVDQNDDAGSHHICIDLSSTSGGNFCSVTGQSDWCSSENMPCHENPSASDCSIQQWCVCQWAFASYLDNAGGCDQIQDIVCEAINVKALQSYYQQKSTAKYQTALDCIVERCGLENASSSLYAAKGQPGKLSSVGLSLFFWAALVGAGVTISAVVFSRLRRVNAKLEDGFVKMQN
uniref:Uncharacterized protein n=1 Tax=Amphora coffeiformis TaxID=265554 RepID=A0A7S3LGJ9_9STRA